jgi:hypothetical protein
MNETSKNMAAEEQHEQTNSSIENLKEKFINESIALQDRLQEIIRDLNEAFLHVDCEGIHSRLNWTFERELYRLRRLQDHNRNIRHILHDVRNAGLGFTSDRVLNYNPPLTEYKEKCSKEELKYIENIEHGLDDVEDWMGKALKFYEWVYMVRRQL